MSVISNKDYISNKTRTPEEHNRVEWGKVGRFFGYFFDSVKNLDAIKDFTDYYGQCVSSLPLHKKIGPKKPCAGGVTPHFF